MLSVIGSHIHVSYSLLMFICSFSEKIISKELTGSDLILAGRTCKGCLMGVRGVGEGGVVGQMEPLEHNTAHTKETQEFERQPSPSHANTDITAETAPRAHMHERTWLHTHTNTD